MVTMLSIMKDTDDHFEKVSEQLEVIRVQSGGKPNLKVVRNVDKDN